MSKIQKDAIEYLKYIGTINVKIVKGNKVYKQTTFHNSGRWPLFNTLAYCLSGEYANADDWRPLVLGLYSVPKNFTEKRDGATPVIQDNDEQWNEDPINTQTGKIDWTLADYHSIKRYANKDNLAIGSPAMLMTKPKVESRENSGIGFSSITYSFLVPFTQLKLSSNTDWEGEGYTISPINLVCLYSKNNCWWSWTDENNIQHTPNSRQSATFGNPNAYFFVSDNDGVKLSSLLPKSITANIGEYSLAIDWTLTFKSSGTYVSPEQRFRVQWIDNINNVNKTKEENWGKLPPCPIDTVDYYPAHKIKIGNYTYLFGGWFDQSSITTDTWRSVHLVDSEETKYIATYWEIDENGNISDHPVTSLHQ